MNGRLLGVHPADDGGLPMAVKRAAAAGAKAMQLFTAPPTYYNEKVGLKADKAAKVHAALDAAGIARRHVLVHAAYVEDGAEPRAVASALATELRSMARWLSLQSFAVGAKGNLAKPLKRALG